MLFNFTLSSIDKLQPWGEPGHLSLEWFGLTLGQYWIKAGDATLFEYSDEALSRFGGIRYCDYQVVRLYDDLFENIRDILEPVPPDLHQYITGDSRDAWRKSFEVWFEHVDDHLDKDRFWETSDSANEWARKRRIDTMYLNPPAKIILWSDESFVHVEWNNREINVEGVPAWTAIHGAYALPRDQFISEVQSFHKRLMEEMEQRVGQVVAGALPPHIHVDVYQLERDQRVRSQSIDNMFIRMEPSTDWQKVLDAIQCIERSVNV